MGGCIISSQLQTAPTPVVGYRFIFDDNTAQAASAVTLNVDREVLLALGEGLKLHNPYCMNLRQLGVEIMGQPESSNQRRNLIPTMSNRP